ncbi:MAG: hypothetical protein SGPRY_005576 [Prymnesium sp.]
MLVKNEHSCLLLHADDAEEELLIESNETATKLATTYQLPQPSKAELSVEEVMAMRKREARHAGAPLCAEEEAREGFEAATKTKVWLKKQAEMADSSCRRTAAKSLKTAAERVAEQMQGRTRKEASVPLTTFGKDMTKVLTDIEMAERAAEEKQDAKRRKALSVARKRSM